MKSVQLVNNNRFQITWFGEGHIPLWAIDRNKWSTFYHMGKLTVRVWNNASFAHFQRLKKHYGRKGP